VRCGWLLPVLPGAELTPVLLLQWPLVSQVLVEDGSEVRQRCLLCGRWHS
jgi:hypothetical protein